MRKSSSDPKRFNTSVGNMASRSIAATQLHYEMFPVRRNKKPRKSKAINPDGFSCICQKPATCKFCSTPIHDGDWMYQRPQQGHMPHVDACFTCGERVFKKLY